MELSLSRRREKGGERSRARALTGEMRTKRDFVLGFVSIKILKKMHVTIGKKMFFFLGESVSAFLCVSSCCSLGVCVSVFV